MFSRRPIETHNRGRISANTGGGTTALPSTPLGYLTTTTGLNYWQSNLGITLGGTLRATGTTPPVVTISGSTSQIIALRIEIDGAGTLGVATFRWSLDGGSTWQASGVLTAASVALGSTGITAAFPAGTYTADNVYVGAVAAWLDQYAANNFLQVTATAQPDFTWNAIGGLPAVAGDTGMNMASTIDRPSPSVTPTYYWAVARARAWTNGRYLISAGAGFAGIRQVSSSPLVEAVHDVGSADVSMTLGTFFIVQALISNTVGYVQVGSSASATSALGATDPGVGATLFRNGGQFDLMALLVTDADLTPSEKTAFSTWAQAKYPGVSV